MDDLKRKWRDLPLRTFFILTVLIGLFVIALLSGLIIWGCAAFRYYLLPDSDSVYLSIQQSYDDGSSSMQSYLLKLDDAPVQLPQIIAQEESPQGIVQMVSPSEFPLSYSIEKIEPSYNRLTPKRKLAYTVCGIVIVAAPTVLSVTAIILCSFYFYRRKLKLPLQLLSDATVQIAARNLDFRLNYDCEDEMGRLCRSFALMQDALYSNSREMWAMLEERKNLQASVSHDLRNPIAIIRGYAEHLENKAKKEELSSENVLRISRNIGLAAKRMENYAWSLYTLNQLEDTVPQKTEISVLRLSSDLTADFSLMAQQNQRTLHVSCSRLQSHAPAEHPADPSNLPDIPIQADSALVYRVLENIIGNALRFSRREIFLDFALETSLLSITVRDDGTGFPESMLQKSGRVFYPSELSSDREGHMGIGIAVSRILCHKHGGTLNLSNFPQGGAMVKVSFDVS